MSFAAVQKHVAVLERAGLITKQRHGRQNLVRTDAEAVRRARRVLDQLEADWLQRVDLDVRTTRRRRETMTVTSIEKDYDGLALVIVADFDAPVERVWQLWADPRKLERWWGPPTYPATFEQHELTPGGGVRYYMTDPDGAKYRGWWRIESVEPPHAIEFSDGFADDNGDPLAETARDQEPRDAQRARRRHADGTAHGLRLARALR